MEFDHNNFFDEPMGVDGSFDSALLSDRGDNGFTAINDPAASGSIQTISPHEIFLNDPLASDPSSTTYTNLTSPSMYDGSPDDQLDTSPLFGNGDHALTDKHWFSLFPDQDQEHGRSARAPAARSRTSDSSTPSNQATASPMSRTISMDNSASNLHRLSVTSGITKQHRRSVKALGPIEVDEGDNTAVKRAKNTLAARKSRQKKRDIEDALRSEVEQLTADRDMWRDRAIARGHPVPTA